MRRIDAHLDGDRWAGGFEVTQLGRYTWTIEAWIDPFAGWRDELRRKIEAGQPDLSGELSEGVVLLEQACGRAKGDDRELIAAALAVVGDAGHRRRRAPRRRARPRPARGRRAPPRPQPLDGDGPQARDRRRSRARRASAPGMSSFRARGAGLPASRRSCPELADLGFDVLYLPPVHPIGLTNRKGANNTPTAAPGDPGSPWAIGDATGGHDGAAPRPRHDGGLRRARRGRRRARHGRRAGLRDQLLGRPPVAHRAPGVVQPPPRRDAEVRREPAEEVPGHLQRQLGLRGLEGPVGGAARRRAPLVQPRRHASTASTTRTRSRSPSGSGSSPSCAPSTRRSSSSPRRSRARR